MSLRPLPQGRWDWPVLIATWFGCGYAPVAPGSVGSLAALVIAIVLHAEYSAGRGGLLLLAAILLVPGIWAAGVTAKRAGIQDPRFVVVDEVIGQWVTLAGASIFNWKSWLAAFVLFRILDVWKPPPVRQLERLPGGFGIVADDVMAGLYGALAIFLLDRLQLF
ncbi:MAG TPA: phosphatidylglycerophosphatase A [Bryobacteraceae bacterium]|nr:phosphatidylglycerophosphatase A [Bryobacteraceae bacterium]